jgi:hypothetical protein
MADDGEPEDPRAATVAVVRDAFSTRDLSAFGAVLAEGVRWYGSGPGGGCRGRDEVLATLRERFADAPPQLREARLVGDRAVLRIALPCDDDEQHWFVLALDEHGLIGELQRYSSKSSLQHDLAILADGVPMPAPAQAPVSLLVPFVHVTDMRRSVAFYELLGLVVVETFQPDGTLAWAFLQNGDARLMLAQGGAPIDHREQAVLFYLYAHDLAGLRDHLVAQRAAPGEIVDGTPGPKQQMRVTDPDGYVLMIAQIEPDT